MKKIFLCAVLLAAAATVFAAVPPRVEAQTVAPRIGLVNMAEIGANFERYRQALRGLEAEKNRIQEFINQEEAEVMALYQEYQNMAASAGVTQAQLRQKQMEIDEARRDLDVLVNQKNTELQFKKEDIDTEVREQVETVLADIAGSLNLTLILEKNFVLYAQNELDVTQKVIEQLNLRYPPQ